MVKAELGTKRTCPSCAARFYDLLKNPIVCPKCNANFIAPTVLPSKGDMPAMAPALCALVRQIVGAWQIERFRSLQGTLPGLEV